MPEISELLENTETIVFKRGKIEITCEAYLERISAQNPVFEKLIRAAETIELDRKSVISTITLFGDEDWIATQLAEPVLEQEGEKTVERMPTEAEVAQRRTQLEKNLEELEKQASTLNRKAFKSICERLEYLIQSWDVTKDGKPVPPTKEAMEREFKMMPNLLVSLALEVGKGIFGPLPILLGFTH